MISKIFGEKNIFNKFRINKFLFKNMYIKEDIFLNQNLYLFKLILFFTLIYKFHLQFLNKMILYFPYSLTLYNDSILLITDRKILFLDSSLNNIMINYTLEEYQKLNSRLSEKTIACQYPIEYEGYIIAFINDYLFLFNKEGDKLFEKNLTEEFNEIPYYDLLPIKKINNYLYYVISYTIYNKTNEIKSQIKIFYYSIDINNGNITLEKEKTFGKAECRMSSTISCQIMNSNNKTNILTCFFGCYFPSKIYSISLDIENGLKILEEYYTEKEINQVNYIIDFIKAISVGNKTSALVAFYQIESTGYSSVYNIITNTFSNVGKRAITSGGLLACLNLVYFTRKEQYIISIRDNNQQFHITIMDKNYNILENEEGKINYRYPSGWYSNKRESIIYVIENNSYSFISDIVSSEGNFLKIVSTGLYANLTYKEDVFDFQKTDSLEIEKEGDKNTNENIIKEDKDTQKDESDIIKDEDEKKDIKTDIKENNDDIEVIEVDNIDSRQKCSSYNNKSKKLNLCIKCNENYGYYPVCFYPNDKLCIRKYKECFNNDTKLINYYFNKEKSRYEPCYETCNTCNYGGNEEINNCTSCDYNGIFRPERNDTTNCVKKCKYKYYFTSYGQYKCTDNEQCPIEANLLIKEKNKCIENCILDDKYKFQYDGKCVVKCPDETINENNICVQINKNKCTFRENEFQLSNYLKSDNLDILAKTYAKEFNYTNNHITLFKHESYSIFLYKNEKCINEPKNNIKI